MEVMTTTVVYALTHMLRGLAATEGPPSDISLAGAMVWGTAEAGFRGLVGLVGGGAGGLITGTISNALKQHKYFTSRQAYLYPLVWPIVAITHMMWRDRK